VPVLFGAVFYLYLDVVCAVAVVASVPERQAAPGRTGGPGAVARRGVVAAARRGCGERRRGVRGGRWHRVRAAPRREDRVSTVAVTAYYLECRKSKEIQDKAGCTWHCFETVEQIGLLTHCTTFFVWKR